MRIHFFKPWSEEAWPLSNIEKAEYIGEGKFVQSEVREEPYIHELIFLIK